MEHFKAPFHIYDNASITGHQTNVGNFSIVCRESHNLTRTIKEAIYIRVNDPSLNGKIAKYQLSHIWHKVFLNTSELKLK